MRSNPRGVHGLDALSLRWARVAARLDHVLHRHDPRQTAARRALQEALEALGRSRRP
jgi:hypothetical protein